mgnify:CR=1 FL=1
MKQFYCYLLCLLFCAQINAQQSPSSSIKFTNNLKSFKDLQALKKVLKDVKIIALGENTHGLGEVFKVKADLVKFLHKELGFSLLLFESGYGDAALAWNKINKLSARDYTKTFTSYYYYHSEELLDLMMYVKAQSTTNKPLMIQGIDCQPQQNYLIQRMVQLMQPIDAAFAKKAKLEMQSFFYLYQHENKKDSTAFYKQRKQFTQFINQYEKLLNTKGQKLIPTHATKTEIEAVKRTLQIFRKTYQNVPYGGMMGWPLSYNIRDKAMFETVQWFRKKYPNQKIIIWAQNSHIENKPKPRYTVKWLGHHLKKTYGQSYYSIGAIVYSGRDMRYNKIASFEHKKADYLAYRLNQYKQTHFLINLRDKSQPSFLNKPLLGMESNGSEAAFVAKDRFDGLLFIQYSDVPKLLKK